MSSQIVMTSNKTTITKADNLDMPSQIVTASQKKRNVTATPYAFTEHGVTILASVLRSKRAADMNIAIVRVFIAMKQLVAPTNDIANKVNQLFERLGEHDVQLSQIYESLENMLDKETDKANEKLKWQERERIGFKK